MSSLKKESARDPSFADCGARLLLEDISETERNVGFEHYLGSGASRYLESLLTKSERVSSGVFFTGASLAAQIAEIAAPLVRQKASLGDPTCGGGDLLLACMAHAPLESSLEETVCSWSEKVFGTDINVDFVEAARVRLTLLAAKRHVQYNGKPPGVVQLGFNGLQRGDFLSNTQRLSNVDILVTNPPFGQAIATEDCTWGKGKIQRAAVFLAEMISAARVGQHIIAVLPDVLRSGTRYTAWRSFVETNCRFHSLKIFGKFDSRTDVDVFILHISKGLSPADEQGDWEWVSGVSDYQSCKRLDAHFSVFVGPVVPHRHRETGSWVPFLTVPDAIPDKEIEVVRRRRFKGTLHSPPFVVIRRTSSPSDRRRILSTLVRGQTPVAVENHLLIVKPKNGSLGACRSLIGFLAHKSLDAWVNEVIRCRHLTKAVVESIPLPGFSK